MSTKIVVYFHNMKKREQQLGKQKPTDTNK
jgi:hypothetical protein